MDDVTSLLKGICYSFKHVGVAVKVIVGLEAFCNTRYGVTAVSSPSSCKRRGVPKSFFSFKTKGGADLQHQVLS